MILKIANIDKHDKILNTSGEKNKEEYITTIKVAN